MSNSHTTVDQQGVVKPKWSANLYIDCKDLLDEDDFSKSDPFAVVSMSREGSQFKEVILMALYTYFLILHKAQICS